MEIWEVQRIRLKILLIRNKIKAKLWNLVVIVWKYLNFEGKNHSFQIIHYNKRSRINSQANLNSKIREGLLNQNDFVGMEEKVL